MNTREKTAFELYNEFDSVLTKLESISELLGMTINYFSLDKINMSQEETMNLIINHDRLFHMINIAMDDIRDVYERAGKISTTETIPDKSAS